MSSDCILLAGNAKVNDIKFLKIMNLYINLMNATMVQRSGDINFWDWLTSYAMEIEAQNIK